LSTGVRSLKSSLFLYPRLQEALRDQEVLYNQINDYETNIYDKAEAFFSSAGKEFSLDDTKEFLESSYGNGISISDAIFEVFDLTNKTMSRPALTDGGYSINDNTKIRYVFDIMTNKDLDYTNDKVDDETIAALNWDEEPQPLDVEISRAVKGSPFVYKDNAIGQGSVIDEEGNAEPMDVKDFPASNIKGREMSKKNIKGLKGGKKSKKQRKSRRTKRRH
jgi:hypothetical protein